MLNLKEPVVDEMGFVYEKEGIYDWLSKQPGGGRNPVRAPIAGTAALLACLQSHMKHHAQLLSTCSRMAEAHPLAKVARSRPMVCCSQRLAS